MAIQQNTALFYLLGTMYGGDGRSTFALPNLQGIMPIGAGNLYGSSYNIGQTGGETAVTLLANQLPTHSHVHQGTTANPTSGSPSGLAFGQGGRVRPLAYYVAAPASGTQAQMAATAVGPTGQNQPHSNIMPFLTLQYVIALQGTFPPRP